MKCKNHSDEPAFGILKEHEAESAASGVIRKHGTSNAVFPHDLNRFI